jgi:hypothetical protein
MAVRVALPAIPLALLVVLTGCGGGGDPTAFATATDGVCRDLSAASTALQTELVRAEGRSEAAAVSASLARYARRIATSADRLAAADPPAADRRFGTAAVRALREHAETMRSAAAAARAGRVGDGLTARLRSAAGTAMPAIPAPVMTDAPDCRAGQG